MLSKNNCNHDDFIQILFYYFVLKTKQRVKKQKKNTSGRTGWCKHPVAYIYLLKCMYICMFAKPYVGGK